MFEFLIFFFLGFAAAQIGSSCANLLAPRRPSRIRLLISVPLTVALLAAILALAESLQ
jgi:H+/Cl- antiporter ClcA